MPEEQGTAGLPRSLQTVIRVEGGSESRFGENLERSHAHTQFNSPSEMIAAADQALYRAKRNGRNRVEAERRRRLQRQTTALMVPPTSRAITKLLQ